MKGCLTFVAIVIILLAGLYFASNFIIVKVNDFVISMDNEERGNRMMYILGETAEFLGKNETAANIYKALVDRKPVATIGSEAQWHLAGCYVELGEKAKARQAYLNFTRMFPNDRLVPEAKAKAGGAL